MKTLVFTGINDPMWQFLLEATNFEDKKNMILFPTDRPDMASISYNPISQNIQFYLPDRTILTESDIASVWLRRLITPNYIGFNPEITDYCIEEYFSFWEGIEFILTNTLWVSRPSAIKNARNKALQLNMAKKLDFKLAETLFLNNPSCLEKFYREMPKGIIYKAINSPNIESNKRYKTVWTTKIEESDIIHRDGLMSCPGILQEFVDKRSDIRVTVFGDRVFAVEIRSQENPVSKVDFRLGGDSSPHMKHNLPNELAEKCRELVRRLGLMFGAIDLALMNDGSYVFFEINPNGQWGWLEERTGLPMRRALLDVLF